MNYRQAAKRCGNYMVDMCRACVHKRECDRYMDIHHWERFFLELDSNGDYMCRVCPQFRHAATGDNAGFVAWESWADKRAVTGG